MVVMGNALLLSVKKSYGSDSTENAPLVLVVKSRSADQSRQALIRNGFG
jgi:hypothetical protein